MPFVITFGVVSVFLIGLAALIARPVFAARRGARRVVGECIRHGDYISHGQTMYYPIFRVVLPDGRTIEHETRTALAKNWKSPKVGTKRPLLYRAGVGDENGLEMMGLMPFLPSIILVVAGLGFAMAALGIGSAIEHVTSEPDITAPRPKRHHHSTRETVTRTPIAAAALPVADDRDAPRRHADLRDTRHRG